MAAVTCQRFERTRQVSRVNLPSHHEGAIQTLGRGGHSHSFARRVSSRQFDQSGASATQREPFRELPRLWNMRNMRRAHRGRDRAQVTRHHRSMAPWLPPSHARERSASGLSGSASWRSHGDEVSGILGSTDRRRKLDLELRATAERLGCSSSRQPSTRRGRHSIMVVATGRRGALGFDFMGEVRAAMNGALVLTSTQRFAHVASERRRTPSPETGPRQLLQPHQFPSR